MPTATSFTNTINWSEFLGLFNAFITLLNSPVALTLGLVLAFGVAAAVVAGTFGNKANKDTRAKKASKSRRNGKKFIRTQQKPQLTLFQRIACILFPGFCNHLYKQRLKRPTQKTVLIGGSGDGEQPQTPKRKKTRSKAPQPPEAAQQPAPASTAAQKPANAPKPAATAPRPKLKPAFGLPLPADLDAELAEAAGDTPAPRLTFGLPAPALDLDAALAEADAAEAAAAQAERDAAAEADELQQTLKPAYGLPLPDVGAMIRAQTWQAFEEQVNGPQQSTPAPAPAPKAAQPKAAQKASRKSKKTKGQWKTDLDSLVSAGLQQIDRGSTPYEVADLITKYNFVGTPGGKNKARGEYLSRLQDALTGRENKLKEMGDSLTAAGWQFIKSEVGGFWHHPVSGTSINRNGGSFETYAEATEHAYNSPVRQLKQMQTASKPDVEQDLLNVVNGMKSAPRLTSLSAFKQELQLKAAAAGLPYYISQHGDLVSKLYDAYSAPHLQYDAPIGPEPAPNQKGREIGEQLIKQIERGLPPVLVCPSCGSDQIYGNGVAMACPDCGNQFDKSEAKKRKQKRAKTKNKPQSTEPAYQYDAPIGPEPDARLMYDAPIGPEPSAEPPAPAPIAAPPAPPKPNTITKGWEVDDFGGHEAFILKLVREVAKSGEFRGGGYKHLPWDVAAHYANRYFKGRGKKKAIERMAEEVHARIAEYDHQYDAPIGPEPDPVNRVAGFFINKLRQDPDFMLGVRNSDEDNARLSVALELDKRAADLVDDFVANKDASPDNLAMYQQLTSDKEFKAQVLTRLQSELLSDRAVSYQYDAPIGPEQTKGVVMYDVPPTPIRPRPKPLAQSPKTLPAYTQRLLNEALALPVSTYSGMVGSNDYAVIDRVKTAFAGWIETGAAGNISLDEAWYEFIEWGRLDDDSLADIDLSHTPAEQSTAQAGLFDAPAAAYEPAPQRRVKGYELLDLFDRIVGRDPGYTYVVRSLMSLVNERTQNVDFWEHPTAQNALRADIQKVLLSPEFITPAITDNRQTLIDEIMNLANPAIQYDAPIGPVPDVLTWAANEATAAEPPAAEPAPAPPAAPKKHTVTSEGNWSWVSFSQKPAADVLQRLKQNGARWSKKRHAWYFRDGSTESRIDAIIADRIEDVYNDKGQLIQQRMKPANAPEPVAMPEPVAAPEPPAVTKEPTIEPTLARKEETDDRPKPTPAPRSNAGILPERLEPGRSDDQPGAEDTPALAATPAQNVPGTGADRPARTINPDRLGADKRGRLPADGEPGDNPVRSLGGSAPSMGDPALGGGAAGVGDEPGRMGDAGGGAGRRVDGDYHITAADQLGVGGAKQKYRDNVAAIRLLKQIEAEGRQATPEEQAILVKYVGWGGLPKVFDAYETYSWNKNAQWADEYRELRDLLTDEEYNAARGSTANAHYTAPGVISAMWDGLRQMGFNGGRVLEPAAGVGHFFGLMPDDLAANSQRIATELDSVSGRITGQLYPNAEVRIGGFEESNLPNNFIDLAISNIPFGNYGVHDPDYKRERKFLTKSIHNYFFAKALDKVKPGGVVAFVTSRFTLDSKDSRVREYLSEHADLVGAIRLPNTAFKENAMTDVTTDIIFLRKRKEGEKAAKTGWVDAVEQTDENGRKYRLNEYFVNNPAMMLGKMEVSGNMYRDSADLVPDERNLSDALAQAIETLPPDILKAAPAAPLEDTISQPPPFYERRRTAGVERIREGSYFVGDDDQVYQRQNGFDVVVKTGAKSAKTAAQNVARVRGLTAIREAARDLLDLNLAGAADEELNAGQARLNTAYDAFTEQFGPIHLTPNHKVIEGDPDRPILLALERYDRDTKRATKAAIFRDRVIGIVERPTSADNAKDAMLISMNEFGDLNWERMEELTGKSQGDLVAELGGVIYLNPESGWETAETYLSGNIRQKLRAAEAAAALEPLYERNVAALRDALPRELAPHEIWANLGAGWVPETVVQQFIREELKLGWRVKVNYIEELAQWVVDTDKYTKDGWNNNNSEWAANRATVLELVDAALNARTITIRDTVKDAEGNRTSVVNEAETVAARAKQAAIKDRFSKWVWEDTERATELAGLYNEQFNATAPQKYDGSHLNLPGTAADITLRPHQKDSIWRIVQGGENTLLAHQVGAGKTFTMIAAGMELRRLGLRKKVMHIVLNSTLDQYAADFQRLYPGSRVLVLDAKAVSPTQRKETMSRIATEDWDAIITSHTSFEKLPVQDETFNKFLREQIDVLEQYMTELREEDAKENKQTIKEMEKAKKRLETKLRDKRDGKEKDDALTWEQLGVDHLFVDEAHKFKNLYFPTKRGRVAGIGGSESGRAFDMFIKTRGLAQHGGLTMATGTPIANSVSEMYTMQRYLQYEQLKQQGLGHFDAWANMFGDTVTAIEMKPTGSGYRMFTRFAKFNNVPELLRMYHQVADVQMDLDALGIQRPALKAEAVSVEASDDLQDFIQDAERRAESLGSVNPRVDNMLKIVSDANKAALDMRLIDVELPDDPNSKVNAVVDRAAEIYQRTTGVTLPGLAEPQNLTQIIFLDTSIPGAGDDFSVYSDIKQKLVKAGIAENEVAFIHDAKTDAQRLVLFEKMNKGDIRVLLGSTEKAGTGVNVQRLLYALHHVDAPWRPADIEQREGRILRQGNLNPNIEIYRYATEGSFDVFKWQTLETKAKFISQINSGDMDSRSIEDIDAAVIGYAQMKALASGNPIMLEKIKVEADLRKVEGLFKSWQNRRYDMQRELRYLPDQLERANRAAENYRRLLADRDAAGTSVLNEELGEKLVALGEQAATGPVSAGKLFGRATRVKIEKDGPNLFVEVAKGQEMGFRLTSQPKRNAAKLQALFGEELEQRIAQQEQAIADTEKAISGHQTELDKPFDQMAELNALRERYNAIESEISAIEDDQPAQVFDETTFGKDTGDGDEDSDE